MDLPLLEFLYLPSTDVAADMAAFEGLGARVAFAIEGMGTRVAMLQIGDRPPRILLAGHLAGERPLLVYRVGDLQASVAAATAAGWEVDAQLEIPPGPCTTLRSTAGQRIALYAATRPGVIDSFLGRRDF